MSDKPTFPGLLPAGFIIKTLDDIRVLCVDNFPTSTTRSTIFDKFVENFITPLINTGIRCDLWIDGSFITQKEDPEDIDIIIEYNGTTVYTPIAANNINSFLQTCSNTEFKHQCLCDVYRVNCQDQKNVAYWMGQFGFNRDRTTKGLAVIQINGGK